MAKILSYGWAGPQDPIFGISARNIAERLTPNNWRRKAIVRGDRYVWVARRYRKNETGKKIWGYYVSAYDFQDRTSPTLADFERLPDALAYANDLGPEQDELPEEFPAPLLIWGTSFGNATGESGSSASLPTLPCGEPEPSSSSFWGTEELKEAVDAAWDRILRRMPEDLRKTFLSLPLSETPEPGSSLERDRQRLVELFDEMEAEVLERMEEEESHQLLEASHEEIPKGMEERFPQSEEAAHEPRSSTGNKPEGSKT